MTGEGTTAVGSTVDDQNSREGDYSGNFKRMSAWFGTPLSLTLELG